MRPATCAARCSAINAVAIPIVLLMLLIARRADRDEAGLLARAEER